MPNEAITTITTECPDCETTFEADIETAELLKDPEEGIAFTCPECNTEFEQEYTFDEATGTVTLGAILIDESEEDEEDEDEEEEGEDEE